MGIHGRSEKSFQTQDMKRATPSIPKYVEESKKTLFKRFHYYSTVMK